jgi:DNA-binding MarR family transcriptional regulator
VPEEDLNVVTDAVLAASRAFVAIAARSVTDLLADITLPQYRVLVVLATSGPRSLRVLAEALDASPSTTSRLCERLARKKLIRRQASRSDRREVRLSATDNGLTLYQEVIARRRETIAGIVRAVPAAKRSHMVDGLTAFTDAAGAAPEQPWSVGWTSLDSK